MILFGCCYAGMLVSPEGLYYEIPPIPTTSKPSSIPAGDRSLLVPRNFRASPEVLFQSIPDQR